MWYLFLLIDEFCGFFLANVWCISWFSLEQQLLNFWNFSELLIKVTSIFFFFFHAINRNVVQFFLPMTHWRILWLFFHTDWWISEIFSHIRLRNFAILLWKQMIKFTIYFLWSMNILHEFFLLRPKKEMKQKCSSKITVWTIASIN